MVPPKATFLGIPLELRNKIYRYAVELPDVFLICECPKHLRTELGLCDTSLQIFSADTEGCRMTTRLKKPRLPLLLLCKQVADELTTISVKLPVLIFCGAFCCQCYLEGSCQRRGCLKRTDIWAVKVKKSARPHDIFWGIRGTITHKIMNMPDGMGQFSYKAVSFTDSGYDPSAIRIVETCYENDENCSYLQQALAQAKLHKEAVASIWK